jgi:epoxyqueuosine reductase QueG
LRGEGDKCLSAITQQKAPLSDDEMLLLKRYNTAWGCDLCQTACPHNKRALREGTATSPISFFREARIPYITPAVLAEMTDAEFASRAFSFRGRAVLERNLKVLFAKDNTKQIDK